LLHSLFSFLFVTCFHFSPSLSLSVSDWR
jgi:hypothetical protein